MLFLMRGLARFSRCLSAPIMSTIWRRRATRSASCWVLGRAAACCEAGRLAEVGDHRRIDRVGLGALADGLGEGPDLRRIGDRDRQTGRRRGRNDDGLEAAGCFEHDEVGLQHLEPRYEVLQPGASARDGEKLTARPHGNIEAVLRNVDTVWSCPC